MKTVLSTRFLDIPDGVSVTVLSRKVTVVGPRGTLVREFKHLQLDMKMVSKNKLRVDVFFGHRKQLACIRTVCSLIENMAIGVTKGFLYKMRFVYSHFPINVTTAGNNIEIRNFLGEKLVRRVALLDGVTYTRTADVKDQIELSGADLQAVSLTAAKISQMTLTRHKDIRKFLDGIYVSWKGNIDMPDPAGEK